MQALRYQQPKLLRYAQELMNDPKLSWRESVKTFLKNCCYGEKVGFAVLSIEEEQQVYRCLSNENFQAFRNDQLYLYRNLLTIFGVPMDNIDPRLFGNLSLTMMMSYKAIPDTMPFLFPEVADDIENYPYTILFNLSGDRPELCKERNRLQLRKSGYSLKVDHNMLMLFTWPILEQFTPEKVKDLISYYRVHKKPMIELANGWYHIEILGGETLQDGDYEPTFEFVIQPATNEEATINADMNFSFEITSSAY